MKRIIPIKLMIPTKARIISSPKKYEVKPVDAVGMTAKMDKRVNINAIAVMTGIITCIKLAVRPIFLPDSSDISIPGCYFAAF
jgi:hypothetical protein